MRLLLIEDNEGDVELIKSAVERAFSSVRWWVYEYGEMALNHLKLMELAVSTELPTLILLDFNLPKVSGHEVLKYLKSHPIWRNIPVIITSTSEAASDCDYAKKHGISRYVVKEVDYKVFSFELIQAIKQVLSDL